MSSTKTTDKSVWHICDDCLTPMEKELGEIVRKWRTLAKDGGTPYPGMIEWLYKKHDVAFVVTWLKLCVSVDFANDFERTLFDPLKKLQSLHTKVLQFDRSLYFTGQTIKEFLDKRYELHRKRGHSREDISDKELEYVENADSEIEHLFLYAIRYLQQVAAILRAKLRGKEIGKADIPKDEKYLLSSEVQKMFSIKHKAVMGFCDRNKIPTKRIGRRFWVSILPFVTTYAQDTNVRTDNALRQRAAVAIQQHEIAAQLDSATSQFFGV